MTFDSPIPDHLIQTKLYPPRVPEGLVKRQHLLDRMSRGRIPPVTLISAPAGYGKSTLAHQWLEVSKIPYAWLSLDEYDHEFDVFVDYLLAAIRLVYPEKGMETEGMLKQPQLPRAARLADSLVRDLQGLAHPICLAIDDYHTMSDRKVHSFMARLLKRLPADFHLLLISRADPPLSLARLRASGQLREIRAKHLRFTQEEAAQMLAHIVGRPVSGEMAERLTKRTEGWAVGLRMAAMSMRESPDGGAFSGRYSSMGQRLVSDYLLSEVLEKLPRERQALFLITAVPDRFSAALVDALAGDFHVQDSGQEFIDLLWSSNYFLIALDGQGTWYRYHHLFRQLLQQRLANELTEQEITALHQKAGAWFEQEGMIEDALLHYVQGGAGDRAARLVECHAHEALNQEKWRRIDRWIHQLPAENRTRPGLLVIQAAIWQLQMRFSSIPLLLDAALEGLDSGKYDYPPEEAASWRGCVDLYCGISFIASNSPRNSLQQMEKALEQIVPSASYMRGMAEFFYFVALHQSGKTTQAIETAQQALERNIGPLDVRTNRLIMALIHIHYDEANVTSLRNLGRTFKEMALRTGHQVSLGWANFALGYAAYQNNDLEEAVAYFSEAAANRFSLNVRCAIDSLTGLALCQVGLGRAQEANETLESMHEYLVDQDAYMLFPLVDSLRVRIEEDWGAVTMGKEAFAGALEQLASEVWEKPFITNCRAAIRRGDAGMLDEVRRTLAEGSQFAKSRNNRKHFMTLSVLEALLHEKLGKHGQALSTLQTAVSLGESGGALRLFVDVGPQLLPLLHELHAQGVAPSYIERIVAAFGKTAALDPSLEGDQAGATAGLSAEAAAIVAELTNREMDVLIHLGQRMTNKEIAAKLHISPHTVKKYTLDIYKKLDVDGRRQAVARALELRIL